MNPEIINNLRGYLVFLAGKLDMEFYESDLSNWEALSAEGKSLAMKEWYAELNLTQGQLLSYENEFLATLRPAPVTFLQPQIIEDHKKYMPVTPEERPQVHDAPLKEDLKPVTREKPQKPVEKPPKEVPQPIVPDPKPVKKTAYVVALLLIGAAFIGYKYYTYDKIGYVYCLTDNLAIRNSVTDKINYKGRMDVYGSYHDIYGHAAAGIYKLHLLSETPVDSFWSVSTGGSFLDYLLSPFSSKNGFVHMAYTTRDEHRYELFCKVFNDLKDDANDMDKLQFIYRKMIVDALNAYDFSVVKEGIDTIPLKPAAVNSNGEKNLETSLVIKHSCNYEKRPSGILPLNVAEYSPKDQNNNPLQRYAVVHLSDDNYYSIVADENGTVKNVLAVHLHNSENSLGNLSYLYGSGRFVFNTAKELLYWGDCNNSHGYWAKVPFNHFTENSRGTY